MGKIESYNEGTIFKIFLNDNRFYYFDTLSQSNIPLGDSSLNNLRPDDLDISCAVICDEPNTTGCDDNSLISNNNSCLIANNGDFLIHN